MDRLGRIAKVYKVQGRRVRPGYNHPVEISARHAVPPPDAPALPGAFLERMRGLLGDEYPAFLASFTVPASTGLRVNTLKISPDEFQAHSPFPLSPVPWCPEGFLIDLPSGSAGELQPGKHPYHAAGLYYLQDPSAMAVVGLLDPRPGELVLDLSAAPGGKATQIAARLKGQGVLIANEIHPQRAWELAENLERWGARNAAMLNETPPRLAGHFGALFDAVLLDAPCSGEGMFRKSPAARLEWSPELPASCAMRQDAILESAARLVRPGGRLVYSTCTFAPQENEAAIARFLDGHLDFKLVAASPQTGFSPGRPDWLEPRLSRPDLQGAVRLWPHLAPGEGHFAALLQRDRGGERVHPKAARPAKPPAPALQLYHDFVRSSLRTAPQAGSLDLAGSYLYGLPEGLPELAGLRILHPGWWLGVLKKNRFEPSHALALGLPANTPRRTLELPAGAKEIAAYLRGESFASEGENGWTLVAVDGFPLGWGKRVNGILKNAYPRGLRR